MDVLTPSLGRAVLREVHASAVSGLAGTLAVAALVGAGAIAGADALLRPNGVAAHVPAVVAWLVVREIAPLGVAAAIIARSPALAPAAAAWSAAAPRVIGRTLGAAALVVVLSAAALVGGFTLASVLGLAPVSVSLPALLEPLTASAIGVAVGKGAAFAAVAASIGVAHAHRAARGSHAAGGPVPCAGHALLACLALDGAALLLPLAA